MRKPFRLGMSCCGDQELSSRVFADYQSAGIQAMELSFNYEKYDVLEWKKIEQLAKVYGVELWSFHLPFFPFTTLNINTADKEIRSNTIRYFTELMKKACDIGIGVIVIHPSKEPNEEEERKECMLYAKESLAKLAEIAAQAGAVIAVENLPRTCIGRDSAEMLELLSADSRLRSCFDTNHLLSQNATEYLEAVGDKIITLHVSDYDFKNERHWLPGEGCINWKELIQTLKKIGYQGPWMYEISLDAPVSITRPNRLTYTDFRENYESLISGDQPKAPGTPVLEECKSWLTED